MEKKIRSLYWEIRDIAALYLIYQMRENVNQIKELTSEIQEFVLWFLEGNKFGIEEELYQGMCQNLVGILNDILQGMEQGDVVLLNDALAYGLIEYLQLFVEEEQEEEINDNL